MKPLTQAVLVLGCTVAFFSVPVLGSIVEDRLGAGVQFLLGRTDNAQLARSKRPTYVGTGVDQDATCCLRCGLEWDYTLDTCAIASQAATRCVLGCGPSGGANL